MTVASPPIVPRPQWGASPLVTPAGLIADPTAELWLHHTGGHGAGADYMRGLEYYAEHRTDVHYVDLEYSFVVDPLSLLVYESRGPGHDTAATFDHNGISSAICVMGNFDTDLVSAGLVERLAQLVAYGYQQGWWGDRITGGHKDASHNSTDCPGAHLEAAIPTINARVAQLLAGPDPIPQPKVHPMFSPPLQVVDKLSIPSRGGWILAKDGAIFTVDGSFYGGANSQAAFAGREAAQLVAPNQVPPGASKPTQDEAKAGYVYVVIATSGERYGCPQGGGAK